MRRRYDLRRSDNFPLTGETKHLCSGDGKLFVFTGFPVQSVVVVPIGVPDGAEVKASTDSNVDNGFYVEYSNIPVDPGVIHFSFTAQ